MKRVLLLVAALFMAAGVAWGQVMVLTPGGACEPGDVPNWIIADADSVNEEDSAGGDSTACLELEIDGFGEVFVDNYDEPLDIDGYNYYNFYCKTVSGEVITVWNGGTDVDWGNGFGFYPSPIDWGTGEWVYNSLELAANNDPWGDMDWTSLASIGFDIVGTGTVRVDHITLSVTSEEGMLAAPAPEVSAVITGPHNVDVGADVTLTVVTDGIDSPTYEWDDASTAATLALGVVDAGDTGVYGCTINGEADGEAIDPIEASFTLWVGVATPLAGGLGLGLLAGACALAGVVVIRRKK